MDGTALVARLQAHSQDHLLRWWRDLTPLQQRSLLAQLGSLDLARIEELWSARAMAARDSGSRLGGLRPPQNVIPADFGLRHEERQQQAVERGRQALRDGQVGAILVAGGQGTRLDFPLPKGMFPIAPVTGKTLFQWLAEQLLARGRQCDAVIPWYVMTSDATHDQTQAFFSEHRHFGLNADDVYFFRQGNMPAIDRDTGRILLGSKHELSLSPDGHGGVLEALERSGLFDDMRDRGVEHLFYHQVDNPLLRMCDPAFLGHHILHGSEASTKVVRKTDPHEKVGLIVEVQDQTRVIEYTDLAADLATCRDASGGLWLWAGNTAIHVFDRAFLERVARSHALPFHCSLKRVPCLDEAGELVRPATDNAWKFERFIFDVLPLARRPLVVEISREREFTPLKNRDGLFSPEHVRSAMRREFTCWLRSAGCTAADELPIEIPPLVALDEAELADKLALSGPRFPAPAAAPASPLRT